MATISITKGHRQPFTRGGLFAYPLDGQSWRITRQADQHFDYWEATVPDPGNGLIGDVVRQLAEYFAAKIKEESE